MYAVQKSEGGILATDRIKVDFFYLKSFDYCLPFVLKDQWLNA